MNENGLFSFRNRCIAIGLLAAFLLLFQSTRSAAQWSSEAADVHAYTIAANKVASGEDPYISNNESHTLQYLYPPTFILLCAPLLTIGGMRGLAMWSAFQIPILAGLLLCVYHGTIIAKANRDRALAASVLLLFAPAWRNLVEGQISAAVILLFFGGILLAEKNRWILAGLFLALAVHIKILPLVALPILLFQSRWKTATSMCTWILLLAPLSALWAQQTGLLEGGLAQASQLWKSWILNMVEPIATNTESWIVKEYTPWNHSFVATLHRLFDPEVAEIHGCGGVYFSIPRTWIRILSWLAGGTGLILSLRLAFRTKTQTSARIAAFGLALLMANLAHAQTWTHHLHAFALLIPLLAGNKNGRTAWGAATLFAIVVGVPSALALLLPPEMAQKQYLLLYHIGRCAIPTLIIIGIWLTTYCLAGNSKPWKNNRKNSNT
jgi:hypothetical protein